MASRKQNRRNLPKHSLPSTGSVSLGHFSKHVLVRGSFATLQAKQSEGCKSCAPGDLQPEESEDETYQ